MSKQRLESGQQLLAAARDDHAPTQLERAAVRRALAARLAQPEAAPPEARSGGMRSIGPIKLWLVAGFMSLATLGAIGASRATRATTPARSTSAELPEHPPVQAVAPEAPEDTHELVPARASIKPSPRVAQRARPPSSAPAVRGARADAAPVENFSRALASSSAPALGGARADAAPVENSARAHAPSSAPAVRGARADAAPAEDSTRASEQAAATEAPSTPATSSRASVGQTAAPPAAREAEPGEPAPAPERPAANAERKPQLSELALMQRVQAALRANDPQLALSLSLEHERSWPHGQFQEEREGVRAFAACQLHASDGQARANAFLLRHPHSALAPRVRKACQPITR